MGNGTRHLLGAFAGIVAVPVGFALVFGGMYLTMRAHTQSSSPGAQLYVAVAVLVAGAIVLALLTGTRMSPLASLIPGLVFSAAGVLDVISPNTAGELVRNVPAVRVNLGGTLQLSLERLMLEPVASGGYLLVGVLLLFASFAPSRWRAKTIAVAPGAHRAGAAPVGEEPWPPPESPVPSDPAQHRSTPPLPHEETPATRAYPYDGSGPQEPYGGSGPQAPYGGSDAQPYAGAGAEPPSPFGTQPEPQVPGGAAAEPQAPYRSNFDPPEPQQAPGGDVPGYAPGYRPSSWSGPQAPYPAQAPPPSGEDPYAAPVSPNPQASAFSRPSQPWGPPPAGGPRPSAQAFSVESDEAAQADPTPRTMPDANANANDDTHRMPWSEADQARFRDGRGH